MKGLGLLSRKKKANWLHHYIQKGGTSKDFLNRMLELMGTIELSSKLEA